MTNWQPILPRKWRSLRRQGMVAEADIRVAPCGRLRAKLLVFDSQKNLSLFWKHILKRGNLGARVRGAVNSLSVSYEKYGRGGKLVKRGVRNDPRYFCVIGLVKKFLTTEVVAHESVHAAYCYARRVGSGRTPWSKISDFDEEEICYPAGIITKRITNILHKAGFWK